MYYEKPGASGQCIGLCKDGEVFYNDSCNSRCPENEYQYNGVCVQSIPNGTHFVTITADNSKLIVAKCPHQYYWDGNIKMCTTCSVSQYIIRRDVGSECVS